MYFVTMEDLSPHNTNPHPTLTYAYMYVRIYPKTPTYRLRPADQERDPSRSPGGCVGAIRRVFPLRLASTAAGPITASHLTLALPFIFTSRSPLPHNPTKKQNFIGQGQVHLRPRPAVLATGGAPHRHPGRGAQGTFVGYTCTCMYKLQAVVRVRCMCICICTYRCG